jgi:hypothetical protein
MREMGTSLAASAGRRRLAYLFAGAAGVLLALLVFLGPGSADAAKAPKTPLPKLIVLGASAQTAQPACPASPCQAIGKVTGFQSQIGTAKNVFVAPFDGRIVAWSLKLSAPTDTQKKFFNDFYGGDPSARLSILKPLKKSPGVYKLKSQTPVEELDGLLGTTTTFTLKAPLNVRTGQIVALSVPTWAPVFAIGLAKNNAWLASRKKTKCTNPDDIKAGSAQEALGGQRAYSCNYNTARLLYSATMVRGTL